MGAQFLSSTRLGFGTLIDNNFDWNGIVRDGATKRSLILGAGKAYLSVLVNDCRLTLHVHRCTARSAHPQDVARGPQSECWRSDSIAISSDMGPLRPLENHGSHEKQPPFQERQGVPARWGDPARGIPTPKPPTRRDSHKPGPPLEPGPLALPPSQRGAGGGGVPGRKGVPARRGVGVPARGVLRPVRGQEAWEYHEPGPPNEPGPLAFPHLFKYYSCERGRPPTEVQNPQPPKSARESARRCRPKTGCSGKCSEKCLPLMSLLGTRRTSTFPSTSPSTPFLAGTSPSTLPSTFGWLGVLHFCRWPPRSQYYRWKNFEETMITMETTKTTR